MIARLTGGWGNQAMIYASARGVSLERGLPLQFYFGRSTWDYALSPYNVKIDLVNQPKNIFTYDEQSFAFDPNVYTTPSEVYFRGYFQTEKYFEKHKDIIRKELTLKEPVRPEVEFLADMLRNQNSVFIHVRRGDYLNTGTAMFHGNLEQTDYYRVAVSYVIEKVNDPKFVIFSDDSNYCRQNFPYPVFSGFSQQEDLYLMRNCRHGIGANSTFSWWANWLNENPDKVCVAPKQWFVNPDIDTTDLIPRGWVRL